MARSRKQPDAGRPAEEKPAEPKAPKTGRLAGFNSAGKRYKHLTIPRDLHDALPAEGQRYEVAVERGGRIVATPVAAE